MNRRDARRQLDRILWDAEAGVTDLEAEFGGLLLELSKGNTHAARQALTHLMRKTDEVERELNDIDGRMVSMAHPPRGECPLD